MAPSFEVGEIVGDYRVVGVLGSGGSGEVFKAEHTITKRAEALKVLSAGRPHTIEEEQRFLREIQVQASLDHPNVASVRTAFWTTSGLVLAMELVEGESLDSIIARGRVPLGVATGYILQTLSALIHAHAHGVIHRDIKPGNIVVGPRGTVKLTDFGLAREEASPSVTNTGALAGSPFYMSPEQIDGGKIDLRTDIYSLGVVLYELATGVKPFRGDSTFAIMRAHKESEPLPPVMLEPAIGESLNGIILTALAKNPAERFQTAADFRYALDGARKALNLAPSASGGVAGGGAASLLHSRKARWVAGAALVMSLGAVAGVESLVRMRAPAAPPAVLHRPAPPPAPIVRPPVVIEVQVPPPEPETPAAGDPAPEPPKTPRRKMKPADAAAVMAHPPASVRRAKSIAPPPELAPAAAEQVAGAVPPPEAAGPAPEELAPGPAAKEQPKRRHAVWRALGKIVRPFTGSGEAKPEANQSSTN
ncbi:MAG: serine/threonine-protein kinase [Acidobacteriota bacterium]